MTGGADAHKDGDRAACEAACDTIFALPPEQWYDALGNLIDAQPTRARAVWL
jgi:hypothetical protein